MTCGYRNSAGTDLDSVFLVNSSNAGAVGFLTSSGVDLGNRFSSSSTLGYSVGYRNSAGTDLGYLRGASAAPSFTSNSVTLGARQIDAHDWRCNYPYISGEDAYRHKVGVFAGWFTATGNCTGIGNTGVNWQVCMCYIHYENGYTHCYSYRYANNSTDGSGLYYNNQWCPYDNKPNGQSVAPNVEGNWITLYNGASGTSASRNFAYCFVVGDGANRRPWSNSMRVYQRFYNSYGSTPWAMTELAIDV